MGTTTLPYRYKINGLVDTSKTVLENLEMIANACATWITYDAMEGKWAVVINRADTAQYSFDDSNIIGPINLSSTGLTDYYNSAEVRFPHRDIRDQTDFIRLDTPAEDLLPNEPDNTLTMEYPIINEPVHAQVLGFIELRQSRLDKIVNFQTDYSRINMNAGDIVNVTSSLYGWTDKKFRIIRMEEQDVDGTIVIDVTALEYDADVYDTSDLYRYVRTNVDGINTLGLIGTPDTVVVTKFEADVRPRILLEAEIPDGTDPLNPAGLVESFEFWVYEVRGGELSTWSTDDDTARQYTLLGSLKPSGSNVFVAGTELSFDVDQLSTGSYLFKARGVNTKTAGQFSTRTNLISFTNNQTTKAVSDTTVITANGNVVPTTLGLGTLSTSLDGFLEGNTSMKTKSYTNYNQTFTTAIGIDPTEWTMITNGYGEFINAGVAGKTMTVTQSSTVSDYKTIFNLNTYIGDNLYCIKTGVYVLQLGIQIYNSGSQGGRGDNGAYWSEPFDYTRFRIKFFDVDTPSTPLIFDFIGGLGAAGTEYTFAANTALVKDQEYNVVIDAVNFTESDPTASLEVDVNFLLYTVLGPPLTS
jgi:hypothetical protein